MLIVADMAGAAISFVAVGISVVSLVMCVRNYRRIPKVFAAIDTAQQALEAFGHHGPTCDGGLPGAETCECGLLDAKSEIGRALGK